MTPHKSSYLISPHLALSLSLNLTLSLFLFLSLLALANCRFGQCGLLLYLQVNDEGF